MGFDLGDGQDGSGCKCRKKCILQIIVLSNADFDKECEYASSDQRACDVLIKV